MSDDRTSIILLADGGLDDVKACVGAVRAHTAEGSYELVIVAPDPDGITAGWLSAQSGLSLVTHQRPLRREGAGDPGLVGGGGRRSGLEQGR